MIFFAMSTCWVLRNLHGHGGFTCFNAFDFLVVRRVRGWTYYCRVLPFYFCNTLEASISLPQEEDVAPRPLLRCSESLGLSSPRTCGLPKFCWCLSPGGSGGGWQSIYTPSHGCSGGFLGFSSFTDLINICRVSSRS